jgi:hypothetical protein
VVELAIMVEVGSIVREMGTVTKERREGEFYEQYMSLQYPSCLCVDLYG